MLGCVMGSVQRTVDSVMKLIGLVALVVLLTGCSMFGGRRSMTAVETLEAAGFQARLADTPNRVAMVRALPAERLVPVVVNGREGYVYADVPQATLYVGNRRDYAKYLALIGQLPTDGAAETPVAEAWPVGAVWDWEELAPLWW